MSGLIRLLNELRRSAPRKVVVGAIAFGLISGTLLAFGLASSGVSLPFALSAAPLSTSTPTTVQRQLRNRAVDEAPTISTGCGMAPVAAGGQTVEGALSVNGAGRTYWLHIPRDYESDVPTPLVLAFHGHGGTAFAFERFSRLSSLADAHSFLVVYPQGVIGPDGKTGWDTFRTIDPPTDDVEFVDALLTHLQSLLCVDPARIYATGFSNGGGFVDVLACDLTTRIAAFAPVSGDYFPHPGGCHPPRPVSVLEIHGTADLTNPYNGSTQLGYLSVGQWLTDWANRDGCAEKPAMQSNGSGVVMETWSNCLDGTKLVHYRLIGVGHTWLVGPQPASVSSPSPASTPGGSHPSNVNQFDTATTIWNFFATQQLPSAPQPQA